MSVIEVANCPKCGEPLSGEWRKRGGREVQKCPSCFSLLEREVPAARDEDFDGEEEEESVPEEQTELFVCRHCGERNYVKDAHEATCQRCGESINPVEGVPWGVGAGEAVGFLLANSGLLSGLLFSLRGWWWTSLIGLALFILSFAFGKFFIAREQRELKKKFPRAEESG